LEFFYGLIAAVVFASIDRPITKAGAVLVMFLALPIAVVLSVQFVGAYFEASIPLIGLTLHTLFDHTFGRTNR